MKKKIIMAAAIAAGAVMLTGCGNSKENNKETTASAAQSETKTEAKTEEKTEAKTEAETEDLLSRIREKGEIVIATEGTYMPWCYHDEDGNLIGYDVEVAENIAEKLGVKPVFVECEWDGIFAGLDTGRFDIVANEVEITDERSAKYNFSKPYAYIHTALVVADDNDDIKTFEDLKDKKTANSLTSTYAELAESYGSEIVGVETLDETVEMLLSKRVDATLNADVSIYEYLKVHPDAKIKIAALTDDTVVASIPVVKGEDGASLVAAIDDAITELGDEGVLKELSEKYFGSDISKAE